MEQDALKDDGAVEIRLDAKEAVVLFELLSRWSDPKATHTPDKLCFESPAECVVLDGLLGDLEKQLTAPFKPEYKRILADARNFLARRWNNPALRD
ncbi:hypothetical protein PH562_21700 [Rhizobium sp. CNPSo 4062]|uniref:hypothetical protein n=1 Tax=Rhizobium sp. CNPSo 4062 TaxID=3021410 RepID=UPI002550AB4D|nr:hypothetical protein [Rhizobium sp. CNPSo 4062]MDK4704882.1 hypothetical protein [Rhizobium sp. CNPSo 4062]